MDIKQYSKEIIYNFLLYNSTVSRLSGLFISAFLMVLHWSLKCKVHVYKWKCMSARVNLGLPFYVCIHTNIQALWITTTRCWRIAVLRPSVTLYIVFSFCWKGVNYYKNYILTVYSLFSLCNFKADFFKWHFFSCLYGILFLVWGFLYVYIYFLEAGKAKEKDHKLKLAEWVFI